MYETSGKIKVINDTQEYPSGFCKREFVVTTNADKYPQDLKFEVVKDKCAVLDQYAEGQEVTVSFDVRGNEFNGKYFVNLAAWKIQGNGSPPQRQANQRPTAQREAPRNNSIPSERRASQAPPKSDEWDEESGEPIPF